MRLDVRTLERDLVGLDVERTSDVRDNEKQHERNYGNGAGRNPATHENQAGTYNQRCYHQPVKRQSEVIVRIVDPDHEPVLVPDHFIAAKVELERKGD